ncbi:MAG TPA: hypothetical protein DCZ94_01600 [Lentisphaeria bacterium]|nr:MAG: hypothetical protein A2X48_21480 [Lentisphaerae bacterium GWF2_49_21]HBC85626.1 hypothetical protein [Lentisphaeria bacterium]
MSIKKKIIRSLVTVLVALTAYFILFNQMAANDIVSTLLTAGNRASVLELVLSLVFIALRFFIIVLLPGIVLAVAGSLVMEYITFKLKVRDKLQG